ncbi:MAG: tetratricopeptide repeat protein [Syntrophorhabdales bacterium]
MGVDAAAVIRLRDEGKLDEAIERLRNEIARDGGNEDAHYLHAQLLIEKGQNEAAMGELLTTIRLNPNHSNAHKDLGFVYVLRESYQEAYDNFSKALILDRSNYGALRNLIILLSQLRAKGQNLDPASVVKGHFPDGVRDIGAKQLPRNAERALIIYVGDSIPWYLAGMLDLFPYLNSHTMFWETAEMVRLLNEHGYVVDYLDHNEENVDQKIDYRSYKIIVDAGTDNLSKFPPLAGQTRVFYSTGKHWLVANIAGLERNRMFYQRHGIMMPAERQQKTNFDDEKADYLTYFGNTHQLEGYSPKAKKVPLNISTVHIPVPRERNIAAAKRHFIWLGGHAMIHKGLDLVVEAFAGMPEVFLHIAAYLEIEPEFLSWMRSFVAPYRNILYHGPANVASPKFEEMAWGSLGTVYVSAAEGGPGSVAQLLHFGIIPIVSRSSNVRAEGLCYVIEHEKDVEIIDAIRRYARELIATPDEALLERSRQIREFALEHHTREAYSRSFRNLIEQVMAEEQLPSAVRA